MTKRFYGELTFLALTIASIVLAVLSYLGLISEWKVEVCSSCAALLSLSQAFDKVLYYKQISETIRKRLLSDSDKLSGKPKKHNVDMCAVMYVLAIIVLVIGLSMEKELSDNTDLDTVSLFCFALIFLGYWMDSHFSRELNNISQRLDELEKKYNNYRGDNHDKL